MPVNYSNDLRWRAVWLYLVRGMSYGEIADVLFICKRSVARYIERYQSTGDVQQVQQKHGPAQLLNDIEQTAVLQLMKG